MPAKKYVLSSWKMYPTVDEAQSLFEAIQAGLQKRAGSDDRLPTVIICPPFLSLVPLRAVADDRVVRLGAQTSHWEDEGNYTGEISPRMLEGLVDYVLVGHSERRAVGETDEQVARKVAAVARHGMVPILLVGEDDKGGDGIRRTEDRLRQGLSEIDPTSAEFLVVYEPVWAIGADERASAEHIERSVHHLKGVLDELGVREPQVLYGGTVNEENVDELAQLDVLDGVGAGRASLDAERFLAIIDRVGSAASASR
jgi:triosephosphate isomerase